MKKIIYCCDKCGKKLSDNGEGKPHLSIQLANHSGWVSSDTGWQHSRKPLPDIMQFCNGECLGKYFEKLKTIKENLLF